MPMSCEEIAVLLAKDVMKPVPQANMKSGFFYPYIIVPKKSDGLRPILGLRILNWAFHKPPFKMLTQKRIVGCIRPRDRSAAVYLKDPYFHVSILPQATGQSFSLHSKDGHIITRSCPSGCSYCPPCLHESSGGSLCSLERTGRAHSQLNR